MLQPFVKALTPRLLQLTSTTLLYTATPWAVALNHRKMKSLCPWASLVIEFCLHSSSVVVLIVAAFLSSAGFGDFGIIFQIAVVLRVMINFMLNIIKLQQRNWAQKRFVRVCGIQKNQERSKSLYLFSKSSNSASCAAAVRLFACEYTCSMQGLRNKSVPFQVALGTCKSAASKLRIYLIPILQRGKRNWFANLPTKQGTKRVAWLRPVHQRNKTIITALKQTPEN